MEKYILLDIDGVLTSTRNAMKYIGESTTPNITSRELYEPEAIEALQFLIDKTGAKIVVSSYWRSLQLEGLKKLWEALNLPGELVGLTPYNLTNKKGAINKWTKAHPNDKYVVLDNSEMDIEHSVHIDSKTGLTIKTAEKAIQILSNCE